MDNGITRRGRPCWYRHSNIGLSAINDGYFIKEIIYKLLNKYFKDKTYYLDLLDLFHDVWLPNVLIILSYFCKNSGLNIFKVTHRYFLVLCKQK